ncbi:MULTISPECIES: thioesterase family protein [unclassified Variovorax]|uniref:acyl-CoA thioesterase n=1 Tax=unclassified Variovorax TaxID=663243 RepID=UPI001BD489BA|nr:MULTISPECIES: thioesterase family protein [unclassified Variovorax]
MIDSYESVVSRRPFVVRRRVRWSDCDPAGVVYTGKFTEYVLNAAALFASELAQGDPAAWRQALGVDTPCKGMALEFHRVLWPEEEFEMLLDVPEVREHGYDLRIEAVQAGTRIFSARFSPICIRRDARVRAPVPPALLDALAPFRTHT